MATESITPIQTITGLIIAGGRANRMGGIDKGMQQLDGKQMVQHVIERVQPQVNDIIIIANHYASHYEQLGFQVWPDITPDFAGPLAGLEAGLSHCTTPYLITIPCDTPFLPLDLVARLYGQLVHQKADLAYACTKTEINGRIQRQPLFCLVPTRLLPAISDFIQRGGRKMDGWCTTFTIADVIFQDHDAFTNINTLTELQECEQSHRNNTSTVTPARIA